MKNKSYIIITILVCFCIVISTVLLDNNKQNNKKGENEEIAQVEEDNTLQITNEKTNIEIGETITLEIKENDILIPNSQISFENNNSDVVTLDENGIVTAISEGTSEIKALYQDKEAKITIYVKSVETSNANALTGTTGKQVDVVLMWGQSNMMGAAGKYQIERTSISAKKGYVGIYKGITNYAKTDAYVEITPAKCDAWEYKVSNTNHLVDVYETNRKIAITTSNTGNDSNRFGEKIKYNDKTKQLETGKSSGNSLYHSYGTNMIPYFAKIYCQRTGHNVVIVHAANPGKNIVDFQPNAKKANGNKWYIYESMTKKYKDAITYLQSKDYIINNKFYIAYQGEENAKAKNRKIDYYSNFMTVHNNLVKDLNLSFGAIVYSTRSPYSTSNKAGIKRVHSAQAKLVKNNNNIILGSAFPYQQYVKNNRTPFNSDNINVDGTKKSNSIHLTAAGLSQVGRQVAWNISDSGKLK